MSESSAELRFVCACCRWPDDESRRARISEAAAAVCDWDEVARLAREHRIEGLVANGASVAGVGPGLAAGASVAGVGPGLAASGDRVKRRALEDLGETIRIARALEAAGLDYAILKGVPLGVRAFGTPAIKQSWDVDVLVDPADAVAAARVLTTLGYAPHMPARPFDEAEFLRWSPVSKEAEFRSPAGRTVELHWRVSDHPMLLRGVTAGAARGEVELLEGAVVRTLSDDANLAYLAVHGASHGWSRLKWLADLAGFLAAQQPQSRPRLVESAKAFGTGHAIDQALELADRLLGIKLVEGAPTRDAARLAELAATVIRRRGAADDFEHDREAAAAMRRIRSRLVPGARYRLILVHRTLKGSEDRRLIALPARFHWAYWIIRPFSAIFRTVLRRVHR